MCKKIIAYSDFEIWLDCPHCDKYQERRRDLDMYLEGESLSAKEISVELECVECGQLFMVTEIEH